MLILKLKEPGSIRLLKTRKRKSRISLNFTFNLNSLYLGYILVIYVIKIYLR